MVPVLDDPDPRWANFAIKRTDLRDHVAALRAGPEVPEGVADMLRVARSLYAEAWWCYDFMAVGVVWALLALEAALGQRFTRPGERRPKLQSLLSRARRAKILAAREFELLAAGAKLRNSLAHPSGQTALTPGAAAPMLEVTHALIAKLFHDPS